VANNSAKLSEDTKSNDHIRGDLYHLAVPAIIFGLRARSAALTAGGILVAGRATTAILILLGLRLSRKHTKTFTYGLYKLENIIAAWVGVVIIILAYELARMSIGHFDRAFAFTHYPTEALPVFLFSAVFAGSMAFYKSRVARDEESPSLQADALHSFVDMIALLIISIALVLDIMGLHRVDAIAGLIVWVFLAVSVATILAKGIKVLLDASVDKDVLFRVKQIAQADPDVKKVISVNGRSSGSFVFLHVVLEPAAYDLEEADAIAREIERRIKNALPNVDSVSVEFGTAPDVMLGAVPVSSDGRTVAGDFAGAASLAMLELESAAGEPQVNIVPNPSRATREGHGEYLAVFLGRRAADVLFLASPMADVEALYALEAYGIDVEVLPELKDLDQVAAELVALASKRQAASLEGTTIAVPAPEY
jgi:cation diffusion facilitator family transporter